jgi:signal transduction histidine kinase
VVAHGDPLLLHFAMQNLIENAFKFSARAAAPCVEFGAAGDAERPLFFVRDNGVGFAAEDAVQVFQPFRRLDASGTFAGTGVGLASAAQVIERHGGRIWAESAPGQGATFYFMLPAQVPALAGATAGIGPEGG